MSPGPSPPEPGSDAGFRVDEAPLREWILKAYHEGREFGDADVVLLDALRELLSGPPGGPSAPGRYWFEDDPEARLGRFLRSLDNAVPGLRDALYTPLLAAVREHRPAPGTELELAPNLAVWVASVAGPVALRTEIDETLACALVATALITIARLGPVRVEPLLP